MFDRKVRYSTPTHDRLGSLASPACGRRRQEQSYTRIVICADLKLRPHLASSGGEPSGGTFNIDREKKRASEGKLPFPLLRSDGHVNTDVYF